MSSDSPSEEEDFVVAIKLPGSEIGVYRHGRDLPWTHFELPFTCLDKSNLAYSKTDQCFYLPGPGGNCLCSFDLHGNLNVRELLFRDLPEFSMSEFELFRSYSRAEHWVESSSGERFLVQWYSYDSPLEHRDPRFMVFREEETIDSKYMCYTEDIGDICIFLSNSHPFCVEASSCPGLQPNAIYIFSSHDFAVYDLRTKKCREFEKPKDGPFIPHWIPPYSI
ncbi:PREDICTED: uncharacterized protein LOC104735034 [Camelina sativa]|uniref:Uncharacterized protein LOC104735034 n=1 Tax=Camelina sativa TaxID=90675 RepID=A0ABM0V9Q9_CAMSA|nr:PREDICTED: uncharacterized protein LOC104735034 [Camelina sativa]